MPESVSYAEGSDQTDATRWAVGFASKDPSPPVTLAVFFLIGAPIVWAARKIWHHWGSGPI
jgi:hypothetical protein